MMARAEPAMRYITITPPPPLASFVESLWYFDAPELPDMLERILPSGRMSLLVNLNEDELRWYEGSDPARRHSLMGAAVCGMYAGHFAIDTAEQRAIVGVELTPGGAAPLFGLPVDALADMHVSLDDL